MEQLASVDVSAIVHGELVGRDIEVLQPPVLWPTTLDVPTTLSVIRPLLTADAQAVLLNNIEVEAGNEPPDVAPGRFVGVSVTYAVSDLADLEQVARDTGFYAYATDRDARQVTVWLPAGPLD